MTENHWAIATGSYADSTSGGVNAYTRLVAIGLAQRGDRVTILTPGGSAAMLEEPGIEVVALPDRFGPKSLAMMNKRLRETPDARLLVQYVPQALGYRGMNLPLCLWLWRRPQTDAVMFHEVAFPMGLRQPLRYNVFGVVTRLMALIVGRASRRNFVAIPAWADLLRSVGVRNRPIIWLPVPSNIPVRDNPQAVRAVRRRCMPGEGMLLGHFGTYGSAIAGALQAAIPAIVANQAGFAMLLIGDGSTKFRMRLVRAHPELAGRLHATGALPSAEVSVHLQACDLMVQPYPDGISTRRTSAMAGLAHGRAIATTTGHLTEPLWHETGAVAMVPAGDAAALARAALRLIDDARESARLGRAALELYDARFDVRHTIAALREGADQLCARGCHADPKNDLNGEEALSKAQA